MITQGPKKFGNVSLDDMLNEEVFAIEGPDGGHLHIYPFALTNSPYYKFVEEFTRHMSNKTPLQWSNWRRRVKEFIRHMSNKIPTPKNTDDETTYSFIRDHFKQFMEDFPDKDLLEMVRGGADSSHRSILPFENILFSIPDNGYIPNTKDPIKVFKESPVTPGRNICGGRHRAIYMKFLKDLYSKPKLNRFEQALSWKIKNRYGDNFLPNNTLEVEERNSEPPYEIYPLFNSSRYASEMGKWDGLNKNNLMLRYIMNGNMTDRMKEIHLKNLQQQQNEIRRQFYLQDALKDWWNRTPVEVEIGNDHQPSRLGNLWGA
jgi:hypothetical protein